jgi:hypothetical protein
MIAYVIGAAAAVDAFAIGVWVGKKWGNKVNSTAVGVEVANDVAHMKAVLVALEAKVAPVTAAVEAKVTPILQTVEADVAKVEASIPLPLTADASKLQAQIAAAVAAATAKVTG